MEDQLNIKKMINYLKKFFIFDNRIPNKYMLSINETIAIFTTYSDVISALNLLKKVGE